MTRTEIEHILFDLNSELPDIDPSAEYTDAVDKIDQLLMYDSGMTDVEGLPANVSSETAFQTQTQDQNLKVVANIDTHDHTHHHHHKTEVN